MTIEPLFSLKAVPFVTSLFILRRLKSEWIPELGYRSLTEAERMIGRYIGGYYSQYRPHQHNGGLPPNKAEENYKLFSKSVDQNT